MIQNKKGRGHVAQKKTSNPYTPSVETKIPVASFFLSRRKCNIHRMKTQFSFLTANKNGAWLTEKPLRNNHV